ncbi:MAG: lysophospholipid acyltransferase family protein [Candidatus Tectimicrobiota bacterium]
MAALTPPRPCQGRVSPPTPWLVRVFQRYVRTYLRRHFHAVRCAWPGRPPVLPPGPLIVYLNHPAWWDPLLSFLLAYHYFPEREHYAPMEAQALARYRFLTRLGFFGLDLQRRQGAVTFLRTSEAILRRPAAVLWLTPGGAFTDPRQRPLHFRPGLGHLVRRLERCSLLPLALEYPFWEERLPEALAYFGPLLETTEDGAARAEVWTQRLVQCLTTTQERLAQAACSRERTVFEVVLRGRAGVGGVYDFWRACKARWRGEPFRRAHGVAE